MSHFDKLEDVDSKYDNSFIKFKSRNSQIMKFASQT